MSVESLPAAHFRPMIDKLQGVAIWIVSEPNEFEYISDGFEDIWGLSPAAVRSDVDRLLATIHEDDRGRVESYVYGDPVEATYDARVCHQDGAVRWVRTRQFPIDDTDTPTVIGMCTDITAQKRREQELAALNRIIRHDIRTDMNVIMGWATMLEEQVDGAAVESVHKIQRAATHILDMTDIARDYSRTVAGDESSTLKSLPLRSIVREQVDLRSEAYPQATIYVDGTIPDVEVIADTMLRSVFANLLTNAVEHANRPDPVVELAGVVEGDTVAVTIRDNGPGIPDERKESIFEEGHKGPNSSGSGIGLYIVSTLLEGYGGSISVTDAEPTGSTFTIELPIAAIDVE